MHKGQDIQGRRFGRLLVLGRSTAKRKDGRTLWDCICLCGNTKQTASNQLLSGKTSSCGCFRRELAKNKRENLAGMRFGKLLATRPVGQHSRTSHGAFWECECECGNTLQVNAYNLRSGQSKSCGCASPFKKLPKGEADFRRILASYKKRATERNLDWTLSDERFRELTQASCTYCGRPPTQIRNNYRYNGVDRVNNSQGYSDDNAVSCCAPCNYAKNTMSADQFIQLVYRIYAYQQTKFEQPA